MELRASREITCHGSQTQTNRPLPFFAPTNLVGGVEHAAGDTEELEEHKDVDKDPGRPRAQDQDRHQEHDAGRHVKEQQREADAVRGARQAQAVLGNREATWCETRQQMEVRFKGILNEEKGGGGNKPNQPARHYTNPH